MNDIFIKKFKVPQIATNYLEVFFTPCEIEFVTKIDKDTFNESDIKRIIDDENFIKESYQRALINFVNEEKGLYCLNDFYGKLDAFCITQQDKYQSIDSLTRKNMDKWYFDAFYNGLCTTLDSPTNDQIYLVDEIIKFIDEQDRQAYLNYCDCRSLGDSKFSKRTCITYKDGINSFAHRGYSKKINKEEAKQIVKDANKEGLMQTANPNGICNCCGDRCYLFRGQKKRKSIGVWPASKYIIDLDESKCIGCGICVKRCHFKVFSINNAKVKVDLGKCVGCGICTTTCPTKALEMKARNYKESEKEGETNEL